MDQAVVCHDGAHRFLDTVRDALRPSQAREPGHLGNPALAARNPHLHVQAMTVHHPRRTGLIRSRTPRGWTPAHRRPFGREGPTTWRR